MPAIRFRPPRPMFRPASLAGLAALLLAACGGGSDGAGEAGGDPTAEATPLVITASNAQAVTADALQASSTAAGSTITTTLAAVPQQPHLMMAPVEINQTRLCIYGGKFYVKGSFASADALTVGDKLTLTAEGCRSNPTYTLNGGLGFTVLAGGVTSELVYPYALTVQADAQNLSLDQSGYSQTLAGDMRVAARVDSSSARSIVMSGASLRYSTPTYSYTLKNYQQTIDNVDGATIGTTTATVITAHPMMGETVTYDVSTLAAIEIDSAGNVVAGKFMVVSGDASLIATVTAVNVFTVLVDADGNGSYEDEQTFTTAELRAML